MENLKVVEQQQQQKPILIVAPVPITMIEYIYPKCVPHLQKVVDKAPNEISIETIKANLMAGRQHLVAITEGDQVIAVNVLQVVTFDTGWRVLYIPITGGARMDEWLDRFMYLAHGMANELKCQELRGMACRKGWLRALDEHDWYPIHEVIGCKVKQLTPEEAPK